MSHEIKEYGLTSKIVSNEGTNYVPEKFKNLSRHLSICHAVSSLYNHQSNGQTDACIIFSQRKHGKMR